jgi:hypothetical protein
MNRPYRNQPRSGPAPKEAKRSAELLSHCFELSPLQVSFFDRYFPVAAGVIVSIGPI